MVKKVSREISPTVTEINPFKDRENQKVYKHSKISYLLETHFINPHEQHNYFIFYFFLQLF